jgi:hypothetical protein
MRIPLLAVSFLEFSLGWSQSLSKAASAAAGVLFLVFWLCGGAGAEPVNSQQSSSDILAPIRNADVIAIIGTCASLGEEAVLSATANPVSEGNKSRPSLSKIFNAGKLNIDIPETRSQTSVKGAFDDNVCSEGLIAAPNVFAVSDTDIKQRLCLQAFHWPTADSATSESHLTLNDVTVDASAFIDLTQDASDGVSSEKAGARIFEMLGFRTRSLIYNFGAEPRPPSFTKSYLNGVQFEQVYSAGSKVTNTRNKANNGVVTCGYDPDNAGGKNVVGDNVDDLSSPLPAPDVDDVMFLLRSNKAESTQPFAAFVDVFQKNGDDDTAKQLRIVKAHTELINNTDRLFGWNIEDEETPTSPSETSALASSAAIWVSIQGAMIFVTDLIRLVFGYILWFLADGGYRPEKVGWYVGLIILLSFAYFWLFIRVIAIKPEKKQLLLPIGATFLFDRLLPAYQIRQDHYNIEAYLERVPKNHPRSRSFKYMKMTFYVAEANEKTVQRIERVLDLIKFVGLVLAVFLVAALNSLVNH